MTRSVQPDKREAKCDELLRAFEQWLFARTAPAGNDIYIEQTRARLHAALLPLCDHDEAGK